MYNDWTCEACNGPLIPLGVLGRTEHARCRACGLDQSRPAQPDEGSDEPDPNQEALNPLFQSDPEDQILADEAFSNDMKPRP